MIDKMLRLLGRAPGCRIQSGLIHTHARSAYPRSPYYGIDRSVMNDIERARMWRDVHESGRRSWSLLEEYFGRLRRGESPYAIAMDLTRRSSTHREFVIGLDAKVIQFRSQ